MQIVKAAAAISEAARPCFIPGEVVSSGAEQNYLSFLTGLYSVTTTLTGWEYPHDYEYF